MLEFAFLEMPDLMGSLSSVALSKIVGVPDCPDYFIDWVINHGGRSGHSVVLKRFSLCERDLKTIASKNNGKTSEEAARKLFAQDYSTARYRRD